MKPDALVGVPETWSQPPSGGCVLKHADSAKCARRHAPAAFGRLCVETASRRIPAHCVYPAAFGRLCVETNRILPFGAFVPPAAFGRLCVETPELRGNDSGKKSQPPSGGCVLKHKLQIIRLERTAQPPSGGCVLKQTCKLFENHRMAQPPSGGCVLKQNQPRPSTKRRQPAAFGRLCVETSEQVAEEAASEPSRLRAAVC